MILFDVFTNLPLYLPAILTRRLGDYEALSIWAKPNIRPKVVLRRLARLSAQL